MKSKLVGKNYLFFYVVLFLLWRRTLFFYIFGKKIFSKLKNLKPSKGGEIHITDAIQSLINDKEKFIAHNFTGKYLDCGTMDGYINSSKEIAKL